MVSVLCLTNCNSCDVTPPPPDNGPESDTTQTDLHSPQPPENAVIFMDISSSMQGYLDNSSDSRFTGVISQFLNLPKETTVKLFGETESKQTLNKEDFQDQLNNRKINWAKESNLQDMVKSMIKLVNTGGKDVSFLITDGILSGSNKQIADSPDRAYNLKNKEVMQGNLESAFNDTKNNPLSALIIQYVSRFTGNYSCYNNAQLPIKDKERPFYIVVIGKWSPVKYIENMLIEKKKEHKQSTPYNQIVMFGDNESLRNVAFTQRKGLKLDKNKKYIINNNNENVILSSDISTLPEYMQSVDYFSKNLELKIEYPNSSAQTLEKENYELSTDTKDGKARLYLEITDPDVLRKSTLHIIIKNILPEWITEISDDNDLDILSNPVKMKKTFNFKYFANGFRGLNTSDELLNQKINFK